MPRKLEVQIVGDSASLERALGRAGDATEKTGSKFGGLAKMAVLGAGAAGVGALVVGLKGTIDAAKESEAAQARLQSALDSAGVSYKAHGAAIDDAIQKTSKLAALDDEDLSDSFAKLVRGTGDVSKSIEGMNLAADIARARHISLEAATKTVEKAMEGSTTAFKKVGVEIDKGTTATEAFHKAQKQFSGAAESYGKTAAGAQDKLGVAFENLQEVVGAKLLPVLVKLAEVMVVAIEWTERNWPRFSAAFNEAVAKVRTVLDTLKPIFDAVVKVITDVVTLVSDLLHGRWGKIWDDAKQIVVDELRLVVAQIEVAWPLMKKAMEALGEKLLDGLKAGITGIVTAVEEKLNAIGDAIRNAAGGVLAKAKAFGGAILDGVADGITGIVSSVELKLSAISGAVKDAGAGVFRAASSFGGRLLDGIGDGLAALGGKLAGWIISPINSVIGRINSAIGSINSALEFETPALKLLGHTIVPSAHFDAPDLPSIPHVALAEGGIVTSPTLAMIGERGPEAVIPLGRGGGDIVVPITLQVDGLTLLQIVQRYAVRDLRAGGSGVPGALPA